MTTNGTGCIVCGAPVEFPEFTLLCNKCDDDNVRYANRGECPFHDGDSRDALQCTCDKETI